MQNRHYRGLFGRRFGKFLGEGIVSYVSDGCFAADFLPVRMFWKASSTLLASSAEVSIKERLFSPTPPSISIIAVTIAWELHTGKLFGFLGRYSSQMSQITLVSDKHNNDVGVRMVPQLFQPPSNIFICLVFADIIHQQSTDRSSIVCGCDCSVSLLASRIPNLRFDSFRVYLNAPGCELDTDRGL